MQSYFTKKMLKRPHKAPLHFGVQIGILFFVILMILCGGGVFPAVEGQVMYSIQERLSKDTSKSKFQDHGFVCPEQKTLHETVLCIPKIHVVAPLVAGSVFQAPHTAEKLSRGVIVGNEGASPGDAGNVILLGHSSSVPWQGGDYKTVFLLLNVLKSGDSIEIITPTETYRYSVTASHEIRANDLAPLTQNEKASQVTLITCWPPGTTLRRFYVQGNLVPQQMHETAL